MASPSAKVNDLVRKLATGVLFKDQAAQSDKEKKKLDRSVGYSLRILGSRMYPTLQKDEFHIAQVIKKKLSRDSSSGPALKFEELFARLSSRSKVLQEKWAILYLLYTLSGEKGSSQVEQLRSLSFNSGEMVKVDRSLPTLSSIDRPSKQPDTADIYARTTGAFAKFGGDPSKVGKVGGAPEAGGKDGKREGEGDGVEDKLLRDIIYTLQGIDGQYILFDGRAEGYVISKDLGVTDPVRNLVRRICEVGWLYRQVCDYVNTALDIDSAGLVVQSFCGALQQELADYYRLVAVLESQIRDSEGGVSGESSGGKFTLRRVYIWIQDPLERLRVMAMLTDSAKGLKGGSLASVIGSHLRHGDPFVQAFVRRILRQMCKPIFAMIQRWVSVGELQDPLEEFFVASNSSVATDRLWQDKYTLRRAMVPSFIGEELAKKILVIGKSINFIRVCCQDSQWITECKIAFDKVVEAGSDNESYLAAAVNEAAITTNNRLMELMMGKYKLVGHCLALKKYLLLGQGDFIQNLLEKLHVELSKEARDVFKHNLVAQLEGAIRSSNAQYEETEFLDRLSVRLLTPSPNDSGWDVFSLDYMVESPLSVVFNEQQINKYLQVFNFLWRLKRVEHVLSATWMRHTTQAHALRKVGGLEGLSRKSHLLRNEMMHFVSNLHNYMMFEVLECAWQDLLDELSAAKDLDSVIKAHEAYLDQISDKALMGGSSQPLLSHLTKIFQIILRFGFLQEKFYKEAMAEVERQRQAWQAQWEKQKAESGGAASPPLLKVQINADQVAKSISQQIKLDMQQQMIMIERNFQKFVEDFFKALAAGGGVLTGAVSGAPEDVSKAPAVTSLGDPETLQSSSSSQHDSLSFLAFRLDFNEFYKNQRQKAAA